ncbi:MAG TPA: alpha/beta hydrolase [Solimonas sp.]|nr:alpha/beta hydrolase [Solimonas sp.]
MKVASPTRIVARAAANDPTLEIVYRDIPIGLRSRMILRFMRMFLKPMLARMVRGDYDRIAKTQLQVASMPCPDTAGLSLEYQIVGRVPGHVFGQIDNTDRPMVLWLHGGAFVLPAAPSVHLVMVAKLCEQLGADGFVPDYRLAPFNRFPAGLDDCERAYQALLDLGHSPKRIVLGGDSAGGNLALGLLQRIRKAGLPMPACVIPVSPVTEMGRVHGPPSRSQLMNQDPLLPMSALQRIDELYAGDWDASDPELSPMYMDCRGLPPMFFLASANEVLLDETIFTARRAHAAGVQTTCHIWPMLPHAFPLFERYFPEVKQARQDIAEFARRHLG